MLTMLFHLLLPTLHGAKVYDLGVVADVIPNLEEVRGFIVTSTEKDVSMQPSMGMESFWMGSISCQN